MKKPRLEVIRFEEADIITASGRFPENGKLYNTSYAEAKEGSARNNEDRDNNRLFGVWMDGNLQIENVGVSDDAVGYAWYHNDRWYCTSSYDLDNQIEPELLSQFTTEYWYPSN